MIHLKTIQSVQNLQNWGCIISARMVGSLAVGVFIDLLTESLDVVFAGFLVVLVLGSVVVDWAL